MTTAPYQPHSDTSRDAAGSLNDLTQMQEAVLEAVGLGATDEILCHRTGFAPNTCRPRRVELVRLGLLADSGERWVGASGRKATVWVVAKPAVQLTLL